MTDGHVRDLRRLALLIAVCVPTLLAAWAISADRNHWDVVESARASAVCILIVLAGCIFAPLALRHPPAARRRGFVVFWFCVSAFFNATWQIPLIVFRSAITGAEHTHANLFKFIAWWGYGFADSHYGKVSPWMMAEELWWLLAILVSIAGLASLRRGHEARAFLLLGVAGALESYNASLYIVENALVDRFSNIPSDSVVSRILYWGFNPLWAIAALLASVYSFQFVLSRVERS